MNVVDNDDDGDDDSIEVVDVVTTASMSEKEGVETDAKNSDSSSSLYALEVAEEETSPSCLVGAAKTIVVVDSGEQATDSYYLDLQFASASSSFAVAGKQFVEQEPSSSWVVDGDDGDDGDDDEHYYCQ